MQQTAPSSLQGIIATAKHVITSPVTFYRDMAKTGGYLEPILFIVVMAIITGLLMAVFSFFGGRYADFMEMGLFSMILLPAMAIIGSFIGAAVLFAVWKLMGGRESFATAYRCTAYASAIYPITAVFSIIPYLGTAIAVVWGMYLMICASVETHGLKYKTALIVFGILGVIVLFINLNTEKATREFESRLEEMEGSLGDLENMRPEEAGEKLGEFLKGMEKAMEEKN